MSSLTKSTVVASGDTISSVVNRILGKPSGTPTKEHWDKIVRKNTNGKFAKIDPNQIKIGETLYFLSADSQNKKENAKVSDGVANAKFRAANGDELSFILNDAANAKKYVQQAKTALANLKKTPELWAVFRTTFVGEGYIAPEKITLTKAHIDLANEAAGKYDIMLKKLNAGISYMVQDTEVLTTTKNIAIAYASFQTNIVFSKLRYFGRSDTERAEIFIHELAHYSFDAGHAYADAGTEITKSGRVQKIDFGSPITWPQGLQGADRYAAFAMKMRKGK